MAKRAKCTVGFVDGRLGPSAILYNRHGNSINVINYPRGHKLTASDKTMAKKALMKGCAELSKLHDKLR